MTIAALLPAAGSGERLGVSPDSRTKQFRLLAGRPVYLWALTKFCRNKDITSIMLVLADGTFVEVDCDLKKYLSPVERAKVQVTAGGATRQASVWNGLKALKKSNPEYVLIHDAARPFLTLILIEEVIKEVRHSNACTTAISLSDTLKRVKNNEVIETIERSSLYLAQTPQAAKFEWLLTAYEQAHERGMVATDDAAILEAAGYKVTIVQGSTYNLKLTMPDDLVVFDALAPLMTQ